LVVADFIERIYGIEVGIRRHVIRNLLERISRGVVLKRRLPAELGGLVLLVSPDASLKYWKRDLQKIDPVLLGAARTLVNPADVVWDIGANIGLFTFASAGLAGIGGQVLAIEPDPWLSDLLRRSSDLNGNSGCSINVLTVAVGDQLGDATLNIARRGRATNFIAGHEPSTQAGGVRSVVKVMSVTLDWLLDRWPAPSVVKIDVEGAEASVLRGARKLLHEVRPRIMCEVSGANRDEVTSILTAAGYALYDAEQDWPDSGKIVQCAWNTIALPAGAA
jgi:FkbM family methyltransferase